MIDSAAKHSLERTPNTAWICLCLAAVTLGLYARVGGHGFINYDDDQYVFDNPRVATGLSIENLFWALQTGHAANWHPLTWFSHMLDCQFYGLNPGLHHLTSVVLHSANGALLFLALFRLTRFHWRSAFVAALFAFHPTHVESVAWIAERKDVLSTFFWLLTILAYQRYTTRPSLTRYGLVAGFFALGLMSKPMVVTLPCVLLLLDYWPLNRLRSLAEFWRRVREKIPLLALSGAAGVVTFFVQKSGGAVVPIENSALAVRLANAAITYLFYLWKTFWPSPLFIPYWYDLRTSVPVLIVVGLVLVLLTFAVVKFGIRRPYLPVGWFWYFGTLVPVIGLVQVGAQTAADRYTYIPTIGIFLLVVWGAADLLQRCRVPPWIAAGASAGVLAACMLLTFRQVGYWRNGETLFRHTLRADPPNLLAMKLLAWTYATDLDPVIRDGRKAADLALFTARLMENRDAVSLRALAAGYAESGEFARAIQTAEEAMQLPHARSQPQLTALLQSDIEQYRAGRSVYAELRSPVAK